MGFVYQVPTTVGGTVLIIERIESQNFDSGVSGWAIFANGDAEFANLIARGSFATGEFPDQRVEIGTTTIPNGIGFFTGDPQENASASIQADTSGGMFPQMDLVIFSPTAGPPTETASITMSSITNNPNGSVISLSASDIGLDGHVTAPSSFQTGVVLSAASAAFQSIAVVFPEPMAGTPQIVVTPITSADVVMQVSTSAASANGFTLHFKRATAIATNIAWVAIDV